VIVYSPTIRRVEETVEFLEESGIAAIPYHAKMEPAMRRQNQERWMSDEVRVLVGRSRLASASISRGTGGDSSVVTEVD